MKDKLNAKLRREPAELLVAARQFYGAKLDRKIGAAFPVVLRPSIEATLLKTILAGGILAIIVYIGNLLIPNSSVPMLLGLIGVLLFFMFSKRSPISFGIVVATADEFVLIGLEKDLLESGQILQRIDLSTPLPEPRTYKHAIIGDVLPFAGEDNLGWYYCGLTKWRRGANYLDLIEGLRTVEREHQFAGSA